MWVGGINFVSICFSPLYLMSKLEVESGGDGKAIRQSWELIDKLGNP